MTAKQVVADDALGQIAKKQWELFRRVKEGTLNPTTVLNALQGIVENEVEQLDIEKVDWTVSSRVHEIVVEESQDFMSRVRELGYVWGYGGESPFILKGDGKRRNKKSCFRLAELPSETSVPVGVIKIYADLAGYDLATAWELLSFVQQSTAMRVIKESTNIIALGSYGRIRWSDTSKESYAYVHVSDHLKSRTWSFHSSPWAESLGKLDELAVGSFYYILLRERD